MILEKICRYKMGKPYVVNDRVDAMVNVMVNRRSQLIFLLGMKSTGKTEIQDSLQ